MGSALLEDLGAAAGVVTYQPTSEELHTLAAASPAASLTQYGSVNFRTRVHGRCRNSTFWVSDEDFRLAGPKLSRAEGDRLAVTQNKYLQAVGSIVVDGYLGAAEPLRIPVRFVVEAGAAPLAGMQRHMLFDPAASEPFTPELTVICTPGLVLPDQPDGCVAVWLDEGVTRLVGTDFFGESKKAATRMWAERAFEAGWLVVHGACLVVPSREGPRTVVVVGPPDTGKSTLALHGGPGTRLVQDDFVAIGPGGQVVPAEDGCIEKTWRLSADSDPVLFAAATRPEAYLENAAQHGGEVDFCAEDAPRHARGVFPLSFVGGDARTELPPLGMFVVLCPGGDYTPVVVRLEGSCRAAYFLLREQLQGLAEPTGRHANRLSALLASCRADAFGVVPPVTTHGQPHAVRSTRTATIVAALADREVEWAFDAELGLQVAAAVPGVAENEPLWPRQRFERVGLIREYAERIAELRGEWRAYLAGFQGLDEDLVAAFG